MASQGTLCVRGHLLFSNLFPKEAIMPATRAMLIDMLVNDANFSDLYKDRVGVRPGEAALARMVAHVQEIYSFESP